MTYLFDDPIPAHTYSLEDYDDAQNLGEEWYGKLNKYDSVIKSLQQLMQLMTTSQDVNVIRGH